MSRISPAHNEARRLGAMDAQTLRDWGIAFNAEGPDGLINTPPPGRPSKLSPARKQEKEKVIDVARETGLHRNTVTLLYKETATRVDLDAIEKICRLF